MNFSTVVLLCLAAWALRRLGLAFYRITLHPLAQFPGPKLAALTSAYEFYFDAFRGGKYTFEIGRMHQQYGPVVRISPDELHVNDPDFIDELYAGPGKPRDKYAISTGQFGIPDSVFGAISHDLHRLRRSALNPFFSKAAVTRLEPVIHGVVDKLCQRLMEEGSASRPVDLIMAFSCMTTDIVTEYAFAESSNFLDSPTFAPNFHEAILGGTRMGVWARHYPIIFPILRSFPVGLLSQLSPETGVFLRWQESMKRKVCQIQREQQSDPASGKPANSQQPSTTIFHELFAADIPESEKQPDRMWQEGQIIIGAGTETTAFSLAAIIFHVLANPHILHKLRRELVEAIPSDSEQPSGRLLEGLPYLSAVITEGLRLSYGVATRLQRINPTGPMVVPGRNPGGLAKPVEIPAGTPVGMTAVLVHLNPELFPEPLEFRPERWLTADGNKREKRLEKYLLSFSKGSRQCIGINLAYSELYAGVGILIRRLGNKLELFETDRSDVDITEDCFVPVPRRDSKGIRVLCRGD